MSVNKVDLKQEEKLVAIIILESYSENFRPFSLKKAECLLPLLGGKTQLDTNIEYLIENGVEEIVLFGTTHQTQISKYLSEEKIKGWRLNGCEVHFLYNFKCQSVGDAMREIDAKNLVRGSFVLITAGSVISNVKLDEYLVRHRAMAKLDKECVLTILCQDVSNDLPFNSPLNESLFTTQPSHPLIIHNNNNRILFFEKTKPSKYIQLPLEIFYNASRPASKQHTLIETAAIKRIETPSLISKSDIGIQSIDHGRTMASISHLNAVQQRNDLVESGVYLCTHHVLLTFTDNFDFESMNDFVKGLLVAEDVGGFNCYIDVLVKKYQAHYSSINNLNSYYFEMMRAIQRTDLILNEKERALYRCVTEKNNVYISETNFVSGSNLNIEKNCFIDSNCRFGNNCELVNCYVGANCVLGDNVKLANCIVWANSQIGDGSSLNSVLVGCNVKIGKDCLICENCVMGNDCYVKDGTQITERGVYVRRDDSSKTSSKLSIQVATDPFAVSENNFCKYFLSRKGLEDDEVIDDDFGSVSGNESEEDNLSAGSSENNDADDTGKNRHFYVCKLRTQKLVKPNLNLARHNSTDSVVSQASFRSQLSVISSDEFDQDTEEEEFDADEENFESLNPDGKINDQDHVTFLSETIEILKRGLKNKLSPDNLILEINSCKHANNIQIDDLCYFLTKALLNLPIVLINQADLKQLEYLTTLKGYVDSLLKDLLFNYFTKTKKSQQIFMDSTLDFFVEVRGVETINSLDAVYVKLVHYLFNDLELLSESLLLDWHSEKVTKLAGDEAGMLEMVKKLEPFIEWLAEDSSDEESGSDDDEE